MIRYLRGFLYDIKSNIRDVWGISDIISKITPIDYLNVNIIGIV